MNIKRDTRSAKRGNLFALIIIGLVIGYNLLVGILIAKNYITYNSSKLTIIMHIACMIIPAMLYFIKTKEPVKEVLRLNKINLKTIGYIALVTVCSYPIIIFLNIISQLIFPNILGDLIQEATSNMNFISFFLMLAVMPVITEELILRGIVLSNYNAISIKKAAIVTGLFFGAIHLNGNQFFYALALGIIMAYLVRITNSIYASMLMHFFINGFNALISYGTLKNMSEVDKVATNVPIVDNIGIWGMVIASIVWGIIALGFFKLIKNLLRRLDIICGRNVFNSINIDSDRDSDKDQDVKCENKYVFNWAFILIIVVFVVYVSIPFIKL